MIQMYGCFKLIVLAHLPENATIEALGPLMTPDCSSSHVR